MERTEKNKLSQQKPYINSIVQYMTYNSANPQDDLSQFLNYDIEGFNGDNIILEKFDSMEEISKYLEQQRKGYDEPLPEIDFYDMKIEKTTIEDIVYYMNDKNIQKLVDYFGIEDDSELEERIQNNNDLHDALQNAYFDGIRAGSESEMYQDIRKQLSSGDNNGFYINFKPSIDAYATLEISSNNLNDVTKSPDFNEMGFEPYYFSKIEYQQYNGYWDFSKEAYNEYIEEIVFPELGIT